MWTPRPNGSVVASNGRPTVGTRGTPQNGGGGVRHGALDGAFRLAFMVFARLLVQITSRGVRKCRPAGKTRLTSKIASVFSFWALMYSGSPPSK